MKKVFAFLTLVVLIISASPPSSAAPWRVQPKNLQVTINVANRNDIHNIEVMYPVYEYRINIDQSEGYFDVESATNDDLDQLAIENIGVDVNDKVWIELQDGEWLNNEQLNDLTGVKTTEHVEGFDSFVKCGKFTKLSEFNYSDNQVSFLIYISEQDTTYVSGVFLKITKSDGKVLYSEMFDKTETLDENSSEAEVARAMVLANKTAHFKATYNQSDKYLKMKYIGVTDVGFDPTIITLGIITIVTTVCIIVLIRKKKIKRSTLR